MRIAWPVAWLLLATLPVAFAQEPAPSGCERVDEDAYACRWVFEPRVASAVYRADLPVFEGLLLANFVVDLIGSPDIGWSLVVQKAEGSDWREVSRATHTSSTTLALRHHDESTHVLLTRAGEVYRVEVRPNHHETPNGVSSATTGTSPGRMEIGYVAQRVPAGVAPSRPAATQEDPHLRDEPSEVAEPAWDLRAAWFDDERLGDGLFDVHVQVGSLAEIRESAFVAPADPRPAPAGGGALQWKLGWVAGEEPYYVEWRVERAALDDGAVSADEFTCLLRTESATQAEVESVRAHPLCSVDVESGRLSAVVPESSIGAPPNGELFRELAARTRVAYGMGQWDVVDQADEISYLFALGGPAVWSSLNERLDPAPSLWYDDPLAPEHAADTLQVAGAAAAIATFLVGLLLVWRRRRHTSRLLARIDALEDEGVDARDTLLALGRLEQEFAAMFRRHRISDAQYQVLSQRIASVATRHALRRELGLDDGVPGEAGPGSVRLRPR